MSSGLRVESLSVKFGSVVALDHVTLDVAEGEILAVLGPSGSGKSTLLRAIAGLDTLDEGRVWAGGTELTDVAVHCRDLGLMFQDHVLFPHLDVRQNIGFGLQMNGVGATARRSRVQELLDLVGLTGYGDRAVHQLSGGEAQRVALARALAPEPKLLMLDEPFGALDRVLRTQLTSELGRWLSELGQTALHVTHDQQEAFILADRVAVFRDGQVEQLDAPSQLWRHPTSAFVATFVGQPNVVNVDWGRGGGLLWSGHPLGRPGSGEAETGRGGGAATGSTVVMIPREAITVVEPNREGALMLTVQSSRFVDGVHHVTVGESAGDSGLQFLSLSDHRVGEPVAVEIDAKQLVLFDDAE